MTGSSHLDKKIAEVTDDANQVEDQLQLEYFNRNLFAREAEGLALISQEVLVSQNEKYSASLSVSKWAPTVVSHDRDTFFERLKEFASSVNSNTVLNEKNKDYPKPIDASIHIGGIDWVVQLKSNELQEENKIFVFKASKAPVSIQFEVSHEDMAKADSALVEKFETPIETVYELTAETTKKAQNFDHKIDQNEAKLATLGESYKSLKSQKVESHFKKLQSRSFDRNQNNNPAQDPNGYRPGW